MQIKNNNQTATTTVHGKAGIQKAIVGLIAAFAVAATAGLVAADPGAPPRVANRVSDTSGGKAHKLMPAIKIANSCRSSLAKVRDYEATFSKRELVGNSMVAHTMDIRLREEPFSVYMRFRQPHEGREVIYFSGRNGGKILAHESGVKSIVGTVALLPTSSRAMDESRYPITMVGISKMLDQIVSQWESELKYDEVDVKYYPNAKIGDVECKVIQTSHPERRSHFKFHMTRLYLDRSNNMPIRVEQYAFPNGNSKPALVEEYTYTNIKPNVGLTDADFDTKNSKYNY